MTDIKIGDWVRFMCGGRLVIGVVNYIKPDAGFGRMIMTECGETRESYILEKR